MPLRRILKPAARWLDSAANEALIMHLARAVGLTTGSTLVEEISGTQVLVVERYDRPVAGSRVIRSHQEDLCQALGICPVNKYQIGRLSQQIGRLLRRLADTPEGAVRALFQQVTFRCVVGDEDGHRKNYSVLLDKDGVRLAPL